MTLTGLPSCLSTLEAFRPKLWYRDTAPKSKIQFQSVESAQVAIEAAIGIEKRQQILIN